MLMGMGSLATIAAAGAPEPGDRRARQRALRRDRRAAQPHRRSPPTSQRSPPAAAGPRPPPPASMAEVEALRDRLRREPLFAVLRIAPEEQARHLPPRDGAHLTRPFPPGAGRQPTSNQACCTFVGQPLNVSVLFSASYWLPEWHADLTLAPGCEFRATMQGLGRLRSVSPDTSTVGAGVAMVQCSRHGAIRQRIGSAARRCDCAWSRYGEALASRGRYQSAVALVLGARADWRRPAAGSRVALFPVHPAARSRAAARAGARRCRSPLRKSERQDVPVWLARPRHRAGAQHGARARPGGRHARQVPRHRRPTVKQGALLAVIDPRPYQAALDQAMAKKAQDDAQLANARLDLQRYTTLAKNDFASRQQVDTQVAMVNQFTAALKGDDAAIETRPAQPQLLLHHRAVRRPGRAAPGRSRQPGARDRPGRHRDDHPGPPDHRGVHAAAGGPAADRRARWRSRKLEVAAWSSDDKTQLAQGTLLTPDNAIDTTTGTIKLKATFPNQDDKLWPGQFVDAQLLLRTEQRRSRCRRSAVQHGPSGLYVYVVRPDSTVQRQAVEAEDAAGRW